MTVPRTRPATKTTKATKAAVAKAAPPEEELPPPLSIPVDLDLDAIERDGHRPGPFAFRMDGQEFTLNDPKEIDWQDLVVAQRNPLMFIRFTMGEAQYKKFLVLRCPEWKMEHLMVAFFQHYGMTTDGPEARALLG